MSAIEGKADIIASTKDAGRRHKPLPCDPPGSSLRGRYIITANGKERAKAGGPGEGMTMAKPQAELARLLKEPLPGGNARQLQKQRQAKLLKIARYFGLSPHNVDDGWKLAAQLCLQFKGFHAKIPAANKANPEKTANDLILLGGVEVAKMNAKRANRTVHEHEIIRDLAHWNSWPTDKGSLETMRRRLQELKKRGSRERERMVKAVQQILPELKARLKVLEKEK
jgi:hypothetical protein